MARTELGQHTASGISLTGVKHSPPWPVESLTPEKNKPKTARSTVIIKLQLLFHLRHGFPQNFKLLHVGFPPLSCCI